MKTTMKKMMRAIYRLCKNIMKYKRLVRLSSMSIVFAIFSTIAINYPPVIVEAKDLPLVCEFNMQDTITEESYETEEIVHVVESGDTLYSISEKYYDTSKYCYAIALYNNIDTSSYIHCGQSIKIPDIDDEEFKSHIEKTYTKPAENVKTKYTPDISYENENISDVNTNGYTYAGNFSITGYTPGCVHCCGNDKGITASGTKAVCGRTVASKQFPFGTNLYIEGYGFYVVEDTGAFREGVIDIAAPSHEECYKLTTSPGETVRVYVVN